MSSSFIRFRAYREHIHSPSVKPITFLEWFLERVAGKISVHTAVMAARRGDHDSLKHAMLAIAVGNQSHGKLDTPGEVTPQQLKTALDERRVRVVIDESKK